MERIDIKERLEASGISAERAEALLDQRVTVTTAQGLFANVRIEDLLRGGGPDAVEAWLLGLDEGVRSRRVDGVRRTIRRDIADTESLLGTVSDSNQLAVGIAMAFISALDAAPSFKTFKALVKRHLNTLAGGTDLAALADQFLEDLGENKVRLTLDAKGVDAVVDEFRERSTRLFGILEAEPMPEPELDRPLVSRELGKLLDADGRDTDPLSNPSPST